MLLGGAVFMFWDRFRFVYKRLIIFAFLCVFCVLFFLSQKQIRMWESMDTFYDTAYRMYPNQSVYVLEGLVTLAILNNDSDLALLRVQKMTVNFLLGRYTEVVDTVKFLRLDGGTNLDDELLLARSYFYLEKFEEAMNTCLFILNKYTTTSYVSKQTFVNALLLMGELYQQVGNEGDAFLYYRKATVFDPNNPQIVSSFTTFLFEQKRYRETLWMLRQFVSQHPYDVALCLRLSDYCIRIGALIDNDVLVKEGRWLASRVEQEGQPVYSE